MSVCMSNVFSLVRKPKTTLKRKQVNVCFWCDREMFRLKGKFRKGSYDDNYQTIDHLVSTPLKELIYKEFISNKPMWNRLRMSTRICCYFCNQQRCCLSNLLSKLLQLRRSFSLCNVNILSSRSFAKWNKQRCLLFQIAKMFRKRICEKLPQYLSSICSREIDEMFPEFN